MARVEPCRQNPPLMGPRIEELRSALSYKYRRFHLSRFQYSVLWSFMVIVHIVSAMYLISCAQFYWLLESENGYYFAGLLAPPDERHTRIFGFLLGILGGAHALHFLSHFGASILAGYLTVQQLHLPRKFTPQIIKKLRCLRRWKLSCLRMKDSASNEHIYALRKTVEITTQILNTYINSKLITRGWINQVKVALVVINCFSTLILYRLHSCRKCSRRSVRLIAVVLDTILATAAGILLPVVIIIPYMLNFNYETVDFPDSFLYGDPAFINLVLETRAFFAITWDDAIIRGVPLVSMYLGLGTITSMLKDNIQLERSLKALRLRMSKRSSNRLTSSRLTSSRSTVPKRVHCAYHIFTSLFFLLLAGSVCAIHFTAQVHIVEDTHAMSTMCLQAMHPWFARNSSCALLKYNCYREGTDSPPSDVFKWVERNSVRKVVFMHCAAFQMPQTIRDFSALMGIELWNITIKKWEQDTAICADLHPVMLFIFFSFVNMTQIPPGILSSELPAQLTDFEFSHTNLTMFSRGIVTAWQQITVLYIEHSHLSEFPMALLELPCLKELSLIDNNIATIPDEVFQTNLSQQYFDLAFSRNPLQKLPELNGEEPSVSVSHFALEFTYLTELPAWVESTVLDTLSLAGSPICDYTTTDLPKFARCGEMWDPLGPDRYPTYLVQPHRSLYA